MFHVLFQISAFAAFADDLEFEAVSPAGRQLAFEIGKQPNILFRPQAPDESDAENTIIHRPVGRREKRSIDPPCHDLGPPMSALRKDRNKLFIWCKYHFRHLVI